MTEEEIRKIVGDKYFEEWYKIVENIVNSEEFAKRRYFPHHGNINVFQHCIKVSYDCYKFSRNKKVDARECAIAGVLHDFYPYIWKHVDKQVLESKYYQMLGVKVSFFKMHGFVHGQQAAENYLKYFPQLKDDVVTNSIKCHMFPLTLPPKYKVGWVVTMFDKIDAVKDLIPSISEKCL